MGENIIISTKKTIKQYYWSILKVIPKPIKKVGKGILRPIWIFFRKSRTLFRIIRFRYPYFFQPFLYFKIRGAIRERISETKGVVIYPPTIDWSWMKQRPQQIMEGLSKKGYLCLYININHKDDSRKNSFEKINNNLYILGNINMLTGIKRPVLYIGWTDHYTLLSRYKNPVIVYDYLDDLSVSTEEVDDKKLEHHKYFLENSDIVCVTAGNLEKDARKYRKDILKLPNAANYEDFHLTKRPPVPQDLMKIVESGKPVVGYYGALAKWFDYTLVKNLAIKRPDLEIVLIGPDYDESIHKEYLDEIENIHWLGIKKYDELSEYLYYLTVTMIPFVVNKITESTSPVKIFEYMSGGKPIVSTALNECMLYESVLVAKNEQEFEEKIDEAIKLSKDKEYLKKVDIEAKNNTWQARIDALETELKKAIEKKK